jgi:hypothetical protein
MGDLGYGVRGTAYGAWHENEDAAPRSPSPVPGCH